MTGPQDDKLDSAGCRGEPARNGEAQVTLWSPKGMRSTDCAVSSGKKPNQVPEATTGGWRRNGRRVGYMKQGDLNGDKYGVHCP